MSWGSGRDDSSKSRGSISADRLVQFVGRWINDPIWRSQPVGYITRGFFILFDFVLFHYFFVICLQARDVRETGTRSSAKGIPPFLRAQPALSIGAIENHCLGKMAWLNPVHNQSLVCKSFPVQNKTEGQNKIKNDGGDRPSSIPETSAAAWLASISSNQRERENRSFFDTPKSIAMSNTKMNAIALLTSSSKDVDCGRGKKKTTTSYHHVDHWILSFGLLVLLPRPLSSLLFKTASVITGSTYKTVYHTHSTARRNSLFRRIILSSVPRS